MTCRANSHNLICRFCRVVITARFIAGAFAAAIPVAQAGVTDIVKPEQAAIALSRVSAASQTGLVIGPIVSAVLQGLFAGFGVSSKYTVRGVFCASAAFALLTLGLGGAGTDPPTDTSQESIKRNTGSFPEEAKAASESISGPLILDQTPKHPKYAQPLLRVIAIAGGWALSLSVSTYSLFSSRFLGYAQPQLSAAMSAGAATTIFTQMFIVPRLIKSAGEHLSCTLGLWALGLGLTGTSLLRIQPIHSIFYLLIRIGTGTSDTATATLVARNSSDRDERARNLGMIQSSRAAARIFTPIVSGSLFARSCLQKFPSPGSLPYLINAGLAFALVPLPLILKRMENEQKLRLSTDDAT